MNVKAFALGFALVLPLTVVGVADAAPRPVTGTLTLHDFPTQFIRSPETVHGTVDWATSRDVTRGGGNIFIAGLCYQGEKIANPDTTSQGRDFVTSNIQYLNTGRYGTTSGTVPLRLWGWEDAEGRIYEMSTAWDDQPGDAWCYVVMADWGKGNYTSYTVPTVIAVSPQWFVDDPRA